MMKHLYSMSENDLHEELLKVMDQEKALDQELATMLEKMKLDTAGVDGERDELLL